MNDLGPGLLGPRDINSDEPYYDVNGDGSHSPIDLLIVFNGLNENNLFVSVRLARDAAPRCLLMRIGFSRGQIL